MATIYKLIIEDDEGKTTVYPLSQGEISIGRKDGNTIRLMERNVSRRHARLLRNNGTVFIEDLDSYNGIRINGERINGRYEVKEGDLVEIGDYHLALQAAEVLDEAHPSKSDADKQRGEWPSAGTVPDFRLPGEILAGLRKDQRGAQAGAASLAGSVRDTVVDTPMPPISAGAPAVVPGVAPTKTPPVHAQGDAAHGAGAGGLRLDDPRGGMMPPGAVPPPGPARSPYPEAPKAGMPDGVGLPIGVGVGPARTAPVPRLICVSTSYAGREFTLARPELIIGRVEDNDIVIEHRSVSRNHAKIVFDGRVHKIIDLQSANGILVNGEEYAMTDLRRGDLIELGHVKFRFIPAGETFQPTDDEQREMRDAGVPPPGGTLETPPRAGDTVQAPPPAVAPKGAHSAAAKTEPETGGAFDPSNAATVTDTPLSALAMQAATLPAVEAAPSAPPGLPPPKREPPSPSRADTAPTRSGPPAPEPRPTETHSPPPRLNGAAHPSNTASPKSQPQGAVLRPRAPSITDAAPGPEAPPRKPLPMVKIALAVVALLVLAAIGLLALKGGETSREDCDNKLRVLVDQGRWAEAENYYNECDGKFTNKAQALELFKKAVREEEHSRQAPSPGVAPSPPQGAADPVKADPTLPAALVAAPGPAPATDSNATAPDPAPPAGDADLAPPRAAPGVRGRVARGGSDQFCNGAQESSLRKYDLAERLLIAAARRNPICYRPLGVLYADWNKPQKAVEQYRTYLKYNRNAADRQRIQAEIERLQNLSSAPQD